MQPETVIAVAGAAIVYHHAIYPALLARLARRQAQSQPPGLNGTGGLPSLTLIVPAHNEAAVIEAKIANLIALDYPRDRLRIIVACDGCTDATVALARRALEQNADARHVSILEQKVNIGKVAILNRTIAATDDAIVALSDASAHLEPDALVRAAAHFADSRVGVVCPTYRLLRPGSEGERTYWDYQTRIKADEAAVGAPMGAHGAFYLFRRALWQPLEADTINDDFILPMRIVSRGYRAVYDRSIVASELERTVSRQEFRRRVRIGAGNLQQAIRLAALADPRRPGLAFVFVSGKGLRPFIPFLAIAALAAVSFLSWKGSQTLTYILVLAIAALSAAAFAVLNKTHGVPRPLALLGYLVEGHAASLTGAVRYAMGGFSKPWSRAGTEDAAAAEASYIPAFVSACKRGLDIVCGLGALAVLALLFIPIALAIKLESRGPIFYRQLRVGRSTPTTTHMFHLIKFRTMRVDAETGTGPVWASKNDPRITRIGGFLRKTRLDELPQCFNVLAGEMSVVGPRPERPSFFAKLEDAIPFYTERTFGLRPGITGLAQVNQAYDQSIEDVRNKLLYDHAYAARLTSWMSWLKTDMEIMFKTITVMALGKGQ